MQIPTVRLIVTGPESSGKTTLAESLAKVFDATLRTEYARQYFENKGNTNYGMFDILNIAQTQTAQDEALNEQSHHFVILDTDALTLKIWSEEKFGDCDAFILTQLHIASPNDFYLLCSPQNIAWENDPLRENPTDRQRLFELYETNLIFYQKNYLALVGTQDFRLACVIEYLHTHFPEKMLPLQPH
jgi:nicotinamide riboside kinase